ncbi:MAG TPA: cation:proton antiporter [Acidimicrobiia bacterium]
MSGTFGAASHDDVLKLVVQIAVLLFAARLMGGLARKLGQPSVVGEILAGVALGPSLISGMFPAVGRWIVPQTEVQGYLLEVVALIGVMFLLIITGLETDLRLIKRKATTAIGVAVGGLVLPFATGLALGFAIPDDLLADAGQRTVFALFVATALSISAIPVLAKILMDLDLMRRDVGQTLLAAGMIDDITGWTLLGLVTALASAATLTAGTVIQTVGLVVVFIVGTVTLGSWLVDHSLAFVQDRFRGPDHVLTLVVVVAFAWGAFTQALHLEPVLGAFVIGILFGRSPRLPADAIQKLESVALAIFAPIFFANAGLKVNISAILEPRLLLITLIVILVATFGKVVGAYAGARLLARQDHWSALAYGSGLNARGALEIIIATIGLSLGILSQEMFSIIVVMAIVTSLMAPVALRYTTSRIVLGDEEEKRLRREASMKDSFVGEIRRILVPVRGGPEPVGFTRGMQATILKRISKNQEMAITLFAASPTQERQETARYLSKIESLFGRDVVSRVVVSDDPVAAILEEAKGYDLMVLGTPAPGAPEESLFGPVIDDLVKLAPCATLIVRGGEGVGSDWKPNHVLVPTNGTQSAKRAAEMAFAIARRGDDVRLIHVVSAAYGRPSREMLGAEVTAELEVVGQAMGQAAYSTEVRHAIDAETGILAAIEETRPDLLVLGTSVRAGSTRLHLGPRVEHLVRHAPCPVIIVNSATRR